MRGTGRAGSSWGLRAARPSPSSGRGRCQRCKAPMSSRARRGPSPCRTLCMRRQRARSRWLLAEHACEGVGRSDHQVPVGSRSFGRTDWGAVRGDEGVEPGLEEGAAVVLARAERHDLELAVLRGEDEPSVSSAASISARFWGGCWPFTGPEGSQRRMPRTVASWAATWHASPIGICRTSELPEGAKGSRESQRRCGVGFSDKPDARTPTGAARTRTHPL